MARNIVKDMPPFTGVREGLEHSLRGEGRRGPQAEVQRERSVGKKADLLESLTLQTSPDASSLLLSSDRRKMEWKCIETWDFLKWLALSETFWRLGLMSRPSFTPIYDLCEVCFTATMISVMS